MLIEHSSGGATKFLHISVRHSSMKESICILTGFFLLVSCDIAAAEEKKHMLLRCTTEYRIIRVIK
jgi:hypothetical protein